MIKTWTSSKKIIDAVQFIRENGREVVVGKMSIAVYFGRFGRNVYLTPNFWGRLRN
jgi:hypothetical protein